MRYVAAYLLAALGGKASPTAGDVEKILTSVGVDADAQEVQKVIAELTGKDLEEVIAEGTQKLSAVPSGVTVCVGGQCMSYRLVDVLQACRSFGGAIRGTQKLSAVPSGGAVAASSSSAAPSGGAAPAQEAKKEEKKEESEESDDDMGFGLFD
ncbi:hypothetical protein ACOMHN_057434 [Nucella lapillus]